MNAIWGIAAIDNANLFLDDKRFILSDLNTWALDHPGHRRAGGAFPRFRIFSGGGDGRWVGTLTASVGAIAALLSA